MVPYFAPLRAGIPLALAVIALARAGEGTDTPSMSPAFAVEKVPVAGGAEIVTLLRCQPNGGNMPLISVLRDTLGDSNPENDRLAGVWVLTSVKPSPWQTALSWIPFVHFRAGGRGNPAGHPSPTLDLTRAGRASWERLLWYALQDFVLDSQGLPVRAPTRTWYGNRRDHENAQIYRALSVLSQSGGDSVPAFTPTERRQIEARMMLAARLTGGFVPDTSLGRVYRKSERAIELARGNNWELLRQRAEAEGLYFEPIDLPGGSEPFAMLWIRRSDPGSSEHRAFDSRFLGISNPWNDARLENWKGYTALWHFDPEGSRAQPGSPFAEPEEMIPLALYSLDHPRAPLLLIDFRSERKAQRRELTRASIRDAAFQIYGYSKFANWYYYAANSAWFFVTGRHGAAIDRTARLRACAQLRTLLWFGDKLDPALRDEIRRRERHLSLTPLDNDFSADARLARQQYEALLRWAKSGLPERVLASRRGELASLDHRGRGQALFHLGSILTLGAWNHREAWTEDSLARLDLRRRTLLYQRTLSAALDMSPLLDVSSNLDFVRASVRFLAAHVAEDGGENSSTPHLLARVFDRTADTATRVECLNSLRRIGTRSAGRELRDLAARTAGIEALEAEVPRNPARTAGE